MAQEYVYDFKELRDRILNSIEQTAYKAGKEGLAKAAAKISKEEFTVRNIKVNTDDLEKKILNSIEGILSGKNITPRFNKSGGINIDKFFNMDEKTLLNKIDDMHSSINDAFLGDADDVSERMRKTYVAAVSVAAERGIKIAKKYSDTVEQFLVSPKFDKNGNVSGITKEAQNIKDMISDIKKQNSEIGDDFNISKITQEIMDQVVVLRDGFSSVGNEINKFYQDLNGYSKQTQRIHFDFFSSIEDDVYNGKKTAEEASVAISNFLKLQKKVNNVIKVYRGVYSNEKNVIPFESDKSLYQGTFSTNNKDAAKSYGRTASKKGIGLLYEADLELDNYKELDAKGQRWYAIKNLGDRTDNASEEISDTYESLQKLKEEIINISSEKEKVSGLISKLVDDEYLGDEATFDGNITENIRELVGEGFDPVIDWSKNFEKVVMELKESGQFTSQMNDLLEKMKSDAKKWFELSQDMSNYYGIHSTDSLVNIAFKNGYDVVGVKNVIDSDLETPIDDYISRDKSLFSNKKIIEEYDYQTDEFKRVTKKRAKELAEIAKQGYAEGQNSNSPSKDFEKLENDAVDGIEVGAKNNEERLKEIGSSMAKNVKEGFSEEFSKKTGKVDLSVDSSIIENQSRVQGEIEKTANVAKKTTQEIREELTKLVSKDSYSSVDVSELLGIDINTSNQKIIQLSLGGASKKQVVDELMRVYESFNEDEEKYDGKSSKIKQLYSDFNNIMNDFAKSVDIKGLNKKPKLIKYLEENGIILDNLKESFVNGKISAEDLKSTLNEISVNKAFKSIDDWTQKTIQKNQSMIDSYYDDKNTSNNNQIESIQKENVELEKQNSILDTLADKKTDVINQSDDLINEKVISSDTTTLQQVENKLEDIEQQAKETRNEIDSILSDEEYNKAFYRMQERTKNIKNKSYHTFKPEDFVDKEEKYQVRTISATGDSWIEGVYSTLKEAQKIVKELPTDMGESYSVEKIDQATISLERYSEFQEKTRIANERLAKSKEKVEKANQSKISSGTTAVLQDQIEELEGGVKRNLSDIGLTYDELIEKIKKENEEIAKGNAEFQERKVFFDKNNKVIESYMGGYDEVTGLAPVTGAVKSLHTHSDLEAYGGHFSGADISAQVSDYIQGVTEAELLWQGKIISNSFKNADKSKVFDFPQLYSAIVQSVVAHFGTEIEDGKYSLPENGREIMSQYFNALSGKILAEMNGDNFDVSKYNVDEEVFDSINGLFDKVTNIFDRLTDDISEEDLSKLNSELTNIKKNYKSNLHSDKNGVSSGTSAAQVEAQAEALEHEAKAQREVNEAKSEEPDKTNISLDNSSTVEELDKTANVASESSVAVEKVDNSLKKVKKPLEEITSDVQHLFNLLDSQMDNIPEEKVYVNPILAVIDKIEELKNELAELHKVSSDPKLMSFEKYVSQYNKKKSEYSSLSVDELMSKYAEKANEETYNENATHGDYYLKWSGILALVETINEKTGEMKPIELFKKSDFEKNVDFLGEIQGFIKSFPGGLDNIIEREREISREISILQNDVLPGVVKSASAPEKAQYNLIKELELFSNYKRNKDGTIANDKSGKKRTQLADAFFNLQKYDKTQDIRNYTDDEQAIKAVTDAIEQKRLEELAAEEAAKSAAIAMEQNALAAKEESSSVETLTENINEERKAAESLSDAKNADTTPIATASSQNPLSLNSIQQGIKNEGDVVSNVVSQEKDSFDSLREKIIGVREAINEKTKAIENEGDVVSRVVKDEKSSFDSLAKSVKDVTKAKDKKDKSDNKKDSSDKENKNGKSSKKSKKDDVVEAYDKLAKTEAKFKELENKTQSGTSGTAKENKEYKELLANRSKYMDIVSKTTVLTEEQLNAQKKYNEAVKIADEYVDDLNASAKASQISKYNETLLSLETKMGKVLSSDTASENISARAKDAISQIEEIRKVIDSGNLDGISEKIDEIKANCNSVFDGFKDKENIIAADLSVGKLKDKVQSFMNSNTKMSKSMRSQFQAIIDEVDALGESATKVDLNNLLIQFEKLKYEVKATGQEGDSLFKKIGKRILDNNSKLIARYFSFEDFIRYGREMASTIVEIDSAMIELRKVSDATSDRLDQSLKKSAETAKELGSSITDVVNVTADWSRLGYDVDAAEELARITTLYKNVGDGIDASSASEYLISTLQGFKLDTDEAERIVDKFNEVANNYAIDSAGIGEALQRSAASFNAANTDLSQSIALITATNAVVQDPDSVGTMWKTVSARIRGAKTELEDMGEETDGMVESTSKLRAEIKAMTGFDIMEDKDTFKSIYDIIVGIGKEWNNLSDIEQASLLEKLAGKRAGNQLAAALNNVEMIESAYQTAENSAGSAMREQENYEKGIQYSLDRLKASSQEWANSLVESDVLKWFVDLGNSIVEASTNFSAFWTLVVGGIGAFSASKAFSGNTKKGLLKQIAENTSNKTSTDSEKDNANARKENADAANKESVAIQNAANVKAEETVITDANTTAIAGEVVAEETETTATGVETGVQEANNVVKAEGVIVSGEHATAEIVEGEAIDKNTADIVENTGAMALNNATKEAGNATGVKSIIANSNMAKSFTALAETIGVSTAALGLLCGAIAAVAGILAISYYQDKKKKQHIEDIKNAAEDAKVKIDELNSSFKKDSDNAKTLAKRYDELAKSVGNLGKSNQNQGSLSTDEYNEFLDISNQLAELFPTLSHGYDDNGNKILELSDKTDTMTSSVNDLIAAEETLIKMQVREQLPDVYEGQKQSLQEYRDELSKTKDSISTFEEHIAGLENGETIKIDLMDDSGKAISNPLGAYEDAIDESINNIIENNEIFSDLMLENGIDDVVDNAVKQYEYDGYNQRKSVTYDFSKLTDEEIERRVAEYDWDSYFEGQNLTEQEIEQKKQEAILKAKNDRDALIAIYNQSYNELVNGRQAALDGIESTNAEIQSSIESWLLNDGSAIYKNMDEETQNSLRELFSNIDWASYISENGLEDKSFDEITRYIERNLIGGIKNIDDDEIKDALSKLLYVDDLDLDERSELAAKVQEYFDSHGIKLKIDSLDVPADVKKTYDELSKKYGAGTYTVPGVNQTFGGKNESWTSFLQKHNNETDLAIMSTEEYDNAVKRMMRTTGETVLTEKQYAEILEDVKNKLKDVTDETKSLVSAMKQISDLKTLEDSLNDIGDAMVNAAENKGKFQLDDLDSISQYFQGLESGTFDADAVNNALTTLADTTATAEEQRKSINALATEYLYASDVLKDLTQDNAEMHIQQLEGMGISNAEAIVLNELTGSVSGLTQATQLATTAGIDLNTITASEIDSLVTEGTITNETGQMFAYYALQKQMANSDQIYTADSIANLISLCETAGVSGDILIQLKSIFDQVNSGALTSQTAIQAAVNDVLHDAQESLFKKGKTFNTKKVNAAYNGGKKVSDALDKAKKSASGANKEIQKTTNTIDLFKRRVDVLNDALELLSANMENVIGANAKNQLVDQEIFISQEELKNYSDALDMYSSKAATAFAKIPDAYKQAVLDGKVSLIDETVLNSAADEDDKTLKQLIDDYTGWADSVADARKKIAELKEEIRQFELKKFQNIIDDYEQYINISKTESDNMDKMISLLQEQGQLIGKGLYEGLINESTAQLEILQKEREALVKEMSEGLANGTIEKGTDEWVEMTNALEELDGTIIDTQKDIEEYTNAIQELHWALLDLIQDNFDNLKNEIENIVGLIDDIDVSDDFGTWSQEGLTQIGLYAQAYEQAVYAANMYAKEIDGLNEAYARGEYSATEYMEKLADLYDKQWDEINASESAKDSLKSVAEARINIMVDAINEEIDAMNELIDKKKEALDAEKELYDYQKSVAEGQKDISKIEKQLEALSGDSSMSAQAKRKQLEAQLQEAKQKLEETEYDHSIESQQNALDEQQKNFEEAKNAEIESLQKTLEDVDALISWLFEEVKTNASTVLTELEYLSTTYNVQVSSELTSAWQAGENAIASYGTFVSEETSMFVSNLGTMVQSVYGLQEQANAAAYSLATMYNQNSYNLRTELSLAATSAKNAQATMDALKQSAINTLGAGYNVDGLVTSLHKVADAADSAATSIANMLNAANGYNPTSPRYTYTRVGTDRYVVYDNDEGKLLTDDHTGVSRDYYIKKGWVNYARGGLVNKNSKGSYDYLAKSVGEDHMIAAREGEYILTPQMTQGFLQLVDNIDAYSNLFKGINVPLSGLNGVNSLQNGSNITTNYESLITVQGDVNNSNIRDIQECVTNALNQQTNILNSQLRKAGVH